MTEQQPVAVLGGGSFGTAVANLLAQNGVPVRQWMRDPAQAEAMRVNRENPRYLKASACMMAWSRSTTCWPPCRPAR